jgi:hypothetical protein
MAAISVLPHGNSLPKAFNNLRLYHSNTGEIVKSLRTDGLIGQLMLLPDGAVLGTRIDTPGLFSKKTCIERWNIGSGTQDGQFCDAERGVSVSSGGVFCRRSGGRLRLPDTPIYRG